MNEFPDVASLPEQGLFAVYCGVARSASTDMNAPQISLYFDSREEWLSFVSVDVIRREEHPGGPFRVIVPIASVERMFTRVIFATWFGIEVVFDPFDAENVEILYGRDPSLAKAMGMTGSQYEGFRKVVPFEELGNVRVEEHDHPVKRLP